MFEHVIECDPGDFDPAEEYPWLDLEYRKKLDKAFSLAKVPPRYSRLGLFGLSEIFADPNLTRYLAAGGRWYLPYQPHATPAQFERGYPEVVALRRIKRAVDPEGRLTNELWRRYL